MGSGTGSKASVSAGAEGNYIVELDVSNWEAGAIISDKQYIIDLVEERVEEITHDFFYEKKFDLKIDGNDRNKLFLPVTPRITHVDKIEISTVELDNDLYTWDEDSVFLDWEHAAIASAYGRYLLKEYETEALFPKGLANIRIIGRYGWFEKLEYDESLGEFEVWSTITGSTSGATAIVREVYSTYLLISGRSDEQFQDDETITDSESAATAKVNSSTGAINNPPKDIKEACIILAEYENDNSLYTKYEAGSESLGGYSYTNPGKVLTGIREADRLLSRYIRRKIRIGVV